MVNNPLIQGSSYKIVENNKRKIHTAAQGLYLFKNHGITGSRNCCEATCSMQIGQIFSTAWFNHLTDSESERSCKENMRLAAKTCHHEEGKKNLITRPSRDHMLWIKRHIIPFFGWQIFFLHFATSSAILMYIAH